MQAVGIADTRNQLARVRKALSVVVEACKNDPSLSVSVAAAARRIGVSRDTIYAHQNDAQIGALLGELKSLKRARAEKKEAERQVDQVAAVESAAAEPTQGLLTADQRAAILAKDTDSQLAARINGAVAKVQETMRMFIGQRRRDRDVADVAKVAYDLDAAVKQLFSLNAQIGTLAVEARRRRRLSAGLSANGPTPPSPALSLEL